MKKLILTLAAALTATLASQALIVDDLEPLPTLTQPASNGDSQMTDWVNAVINDPNCIVEIIGKWTSPSSFSNFASGLSASNFSVTPGGSQGAKNALITWDLTGTGWGLYAVTGHQGGNPNQVLQYNINTVINGNYVSSQGTIEAPGNQNGWSNIIFFGKRVEVPDSGTTLALLGAALLGVIGFRRFKK